jgi:hypothetical protein
MYLENEIELVKAVTTGEVTDGLEGTVGAKLLKRDPESKVVVNFHGVSLIFFFCLMFYLVSELPLVIIFRCFPSLPFLFPCRLSRTSSIRQISSNIIHQDISNTSYRTQATSAKATAPQPTAPSPASPTPTFLPATTGASVSPASPTPPTSPPKPG